MLSLYFVIIWLQVVRSHDACIDTKRNKHVAQNLDNPTWSRGDPYCGYNPAYLTSSDTLKYWNVMNKGLFDQTAWDNKWCGMCLKVSKYEQPTPAPSIIVKLVDYPTSYDFELQIDTYQSLNLSMSEDTDYVDVTPIVCPIDGYLTRSTLSYELGGINHYYLEIVVWDHIVPIEFVYVKGLDASWTQTNNGGWFQLMRSTYNEFESNNMDELQAPFQLKVISIFGEELIEDFASWPQTNSFVAGSVQFTNTDCMLVADSGSTVTNNPTSDPITSTISSLSTITSTISSLLTTTSAPIESTISSLLTTTSAPIKSTIASTTSAVDSLPSTTVAETAECTDWSFPELEHAVSAINQDSPSSNQFYCQFNPSFAENEALLVWIGVNFANEIYEGYQDALCGICLKITNENTDQWIIGKVAQNAGTSYAMELFEDTYTLIGGIVDDGVISGINAVQVPCPLDNMLTKNKLHYQFIGTNTYWISFVIWDHMVPIQSVFVQWNDHIDWEQMERDEYTTFGYSSNTEMVLPWKFKIVSVFNEELIEETVISVPSGQYNLVDGTVQFSITSCDDNHFSTSQNDDDDDGVDDVDDVDICGRWKVYNLLFCTCIYILGIFVAVI